MSAATPSATLPRCSRYAAAWVPVFLGLLVICFESTRVMGADHTLVWLSRICSPLMNLPSADVAEVNHVLRKCGHFMGYGALGLVFLRGWLSLLLTRLHQTWTKLRSTAGAVAVLSVAMVATMDELHQSCLPNRTACVSDVLLDTSGAVLLILLVSVRQGLYRRRMLTCLLSLRTIQHRQACT